ncbi:hypothetical protein WR25_13422, partial [Diploscapter pachys]
MLHQLKKNPPINYFFVLRSDPFSNVNSISFKYKFYLGSTMDPGHTLESPRGKYKIVKMLGKGAFGEVYLTDYTAKDPSNSEQVALKKISLHGMSEEQCTKEAKLMKKISESSTSPHAIKYLDSFMKISHGNLYIAMDYCSRGDLRSKIKANIELGKEFDPRIVYDYIYQIADGINELHKHDIVHRDLKPANILIAEENGKEVLKISDFGLAKVIDSLNKSLNHTWCGTPLYMAPEQHTTKYQSPVDIWAIGIIFYELCIAPEELVNEIRNLWKKVENGQRVNLSSQYSAADTTWLNKMIDKDPKKRMNPLQVCNEARRPDPPEWRKFASVAYFKDKLYYLGGNNSEVNGDTNRVDLLMDGGVKRYFDYQTMNGSGLKSERFRDDSVLESCLCFDPSAPVDSRVSQIVDMNYARWDHSLIVANGKLYAIGGFQKLEFEDFCNSIEEYDPQANRWKIVGEPAYIGIDLGTTYSRISVIKDGQFVVIVSDDGRRTIPSVVAHCESGILVDHPALNCNTDLSNILYDSKRLIGWKSLVDLPIAENRNLWTFNVDTKDDVCGYVLNKGKPNERFIKAEEVSAEILKKLKAIAERYLNKQVTGAVVTIPAFFNNDQINATVRAIQMAGLDLKYLLEEPTAAAIAYYNRMGITNSTIMVFDFGGGTLDISIAEIKDGKLDVKSVCGDAHLGGQDFDERIMKYVIEEFKKSNNFDMSQRPNLMKRLRRACKEAKESLSSQIESWNVRLDINDDTNVNVEISRSNFNQLCQDLFDKAMEMVEKALRTAKISAEQIDNVILVGGSTRIPKIKELLSHKFDQTRLRYNTNPEEAIVHGAAIIADALEKRIAMPLIELSWNNNNSHKVLLYYSYSNNDEVEGRICLFNSHNFSVEKIAKFDKYYESYQVAATQN